MTTERSRRGTPISTVVAPKREDRGATSGDTMRVVTRNSTLVLHGGERVE
jgi:hypothetical protein